MTSIPSINADRAKSRWHALRTIPMVAMHDAATFQAGGFGVREVYVTTKLAELYRRPNAKFIKGSEVSAIAKQYLSFAVARKKEFFIKYQGSIYSGEDVGRLLDNLEAE